MPNPTEDTPIFWGNNIVVFTFVQFILCLLNKMPQLNILSFRIFYKYTFEFN